MSPRQLCHQDSYVKRELYEAWDKEFPKGLCSLKPHTPDYSKLHSYHSYMRVTDKIAETVIQPMRKGRQSQSLTNSREINWCWILSLWPELHKTLPFHIRAGSGTGKVLVGIKWSQQWGQEGYRDWIPGKTSHGVIQSRIQTIDKIDTVGFLMHSISQRVVHFCA